MSIELICIGDELLSGRTQDKNGPWLARFLETQGHSLLRITTIHDDYQEISKALKDAFSRSSVVILSGGLGPTKDDLTKNALASFFKVDLVEDKKAKIIAEKNYSRRGKIFLGESNFYNLIPQGFIACNNPKGLAPGLINLGTSKLLLAAPGVPWEFAAMVEEEFAPLIDKSFGKNKKLYGKMTIRTQGIPEESIFFSLVPNLWEKLSTYGKVASLPHIQGVDIVISKIDKSKFKNFQKEIKNLVQKTELAPFIWQFGDDSLEEMILKLARKKKLSIGLAESASGGLISHRLTNIPGCSDQYMGSVVSYSNKAKVKILGVRPQTLKKNGAVSLECAQEMAVGAQRALSVNLAISITGIAGPSGGSKKKPIGTVCIGWALDKKSGSESFNFRGDRDTLKVQFTQKALFMMLKTIQKKLN